MKSGSWCAFALLAPLAAVILDAGNRSVSAAREAESPSSPQQAMFEFLTANDWCGQGCGVVYQNKFPASCRRLRILRTGEFIDQAFSDYQEHYRRDPWNFVLTGDSAGVMSVGGHSLIQFRRVGSTLRLASEDFNPCKQGLPAVDGAERSLDQLPSVPRPSLLEALCRHEWIKQDDFHLDWKAQTMRFDSSLGYRMRYAGEPHVETGQYSIVLNTHLSLGSGSPLRVLVTDSTLVLDEQLYASPASHRETRHLRGGGLGGDLQMNVTYEGRFEAGQPKKVEVELVNRCPGGPHCKTIELDDVVASAHRWRLEGGSMVGDGLEQRVVRREYRDTRLAPGESFMDTVTIVMPERGEVVFLLWQWNCRSGGHSHRPVVGATVPVY